MALAPNQCRHDLPLAEPLACGSSGADYPDLTSFLRAALLSPMPVRPAERSREPITRRWQPEAGIARTTLSLLDRHPEFHPLNGAGLPVRRVKRLSRSVRVGWRGVFQSMKMGRPMRHLSGIEREALRRCEIDPEITGFVEHPAAMRFGRRRITPSLYLHGPGGSRFLVCCQEATASKPGNEARWEEIGTTLAQAGYGFEVFTELHARVRPRADNVAELLRTRWDDPVGLDLERAASEAAQAGSTIGSVCEHAGLSRAEFLQLVRRHVLAVDLDRAMSDGAPVAPGPAEPQRTALR